MTSKQFDNKAKELFGETLGKYGFSADKSRRSTFYRKAADDIYHLILPEPLSGGSFFDVKVFASSPKIEALFDTRFPDTLGIPNDSFCYLSSSGIGMDQEKFGCKTPEVFVQTFDRKVKLLLLQKVIPYLDAQLSLGQMLNYIRNPLYKALALGVIGDTNSKRLLEEQLQRLELVPRSDELIVSHIQRIKALLATLDK